MAAYGSVGTLFSCVDLTSTATADLTWRLWRKTASGKKEDRTEVTSHLALDRLNEPNDFYSREEYVATGQQHVDLTGEGWTIIATNAMGWPESLWPVRPDRMTPVPSAENFLAGYIYTGPDGEKIPLGLDQVMRIRMPHPLDPYRGLGPVQAILMDAESIRYSVEWNRNFFVNGAEPGGIIASPEGISDKAYERMKAQWNEGHRGVSNAHRVAIIEQATWIDRKFTHGDMQFAQLREVSDKAIRNAFRIHPHMLGDADDVNLANATAAEITFARRSVVPRANRWRGMLNAHFLPKFGPTAVGLEFDYDNPVAEDEAQDAEIALNRWRAVQFAVISGFDGPEAAASVGLPAVTWDEERVVHGNTTPAGLKSLPEYQDQPGGAKPSGWDNALPRGGGDVAPKA